MYLCCICIYLHLTFKCELPQDFVAHPQAWMTGHESEQKRRKAVNNLTQAALCLPLRANTQLPGACKKTTAVSCSDLVHAHVNAAPDKEATVEILANMCYMGCCTHLGCITHHMFATVIVKHLFLDAT